MKQPNKIAHFNPTKNVCKKVYFGTMEEADKHIAKLQKESKREKVPVRSYLCPKCNCWHLTSWSAPDIEHFVEQINREIDAFNAQIEKDYIETTRELSHAINIAVDLKKENLLLQNQIVLLNRKLNQ